MEIIEGGAGGATWWDKVPSKFAGWGEDRFRGAGFRAVPGSIVRRGAFISKGAVLMPSFVNIGAYVGEGSMVDAWRSEEHTSELQSLMRISYAVFCLKKKKTTNNAKLKCMYNNKENYKTITTTHI